MIGVLMFGLAIGVEHASAKTPCIPIASERLIPALSAIPEHQALRLAMNEPMPHEKIMVMLYGAGGHLSTVNYSIVLARDTDGVWRGTAVGRSQVWIKDAPYTPMKRREWTLDPAAGKQFSDALSRQCPVDRAAAQQSNPPPPPPLGFVSERVDVVTPHGTVTFGADGGDGLVTALMRPPQ